MPHVKPRSETPVGGEVYLHVLTPKDKTPFQKARNIILPDTDFSLATKN